MNSSNHRRLQAGLFFLSGFAAVLYQAVWTRRLSLQFGHSAAAIATIVVVFITGLGAGGWIAGRVVDRIKNPIRFYAGIEAVVAMLGLLSWPLLKSLEALLVPFYGAPLLFAALRIGVCCLVLLPSSLLLGAALPVLMKGVAQRDPFVKTVGFFYGFNGLGAAVGVLAVGLLFLPLLGLALTLALAAFFQFGIAALALYTAQRAPVVSEESVPSDVAISRRAQYSLSLLAMVGGFFGVSLAMALVRLLLPFFGPCVYTRSLILFGILVGIGLIGLLISKYPPSLLRSLSFNGRLLGKSYAWSSVGSLAGYLLMVFLFFPKANMSAAITPISSPSGSLLFIKDGATSTVAVVRTPNQTTLDIDGNTDASTGADRVTSLLLGHLPMMFHSNPKRVCVIGYGSGATVRAIVAHAPRSVDVVELEPAVIEASPYFRSVNESVLDDPGVHLHLDDGRTFLLYGRGTFDVIVSNPSSPWMTGMGRLYSHEFYEQVKRRLSDGGVFCQWIQTHELSRPTLNVMIQTLGQTFANFSIFVAGSDFICMASNVPLPSRFDELSKKIAVPEIKRNLSGIGIENPFDLLVGYYASFPEDLDRYPALARNSDDNGWVEYHAPLDMYSGRLPQLDRPTVALGFERYAHNFFPDLSRDQLALGLAASIARLRPVASFRIEDMIPLFENGATVARLKNLVREATKRAEVLRSANRIMADAALQIIAGQAAVALSALRELIDVDPHQPGLQRLLGLASVRLGKTELAVSYFTLALQDNPADFDALTALGEIRLSESNVPAAIACFSRALEANPHAMRTRALLQQLMNGSPHS